MRCSICFPTCAQYAQGTRPDRRHRTMQTRQGEGVYAARSPPPHHPRCLARDRLRALTRAPVGGCGCWVWSAREEHAKATVSDGDVGHAETRRLRATVDGFHAATPAARGRAARGDQVGQRAQLSPARAEARTPRAGLARGFVPQPGT